MTHHAQSGWLTRRQRDGGIDQVPTPNGVHGTLWLCGKHAIGPDVEVAIVEAGGRAKVVCLTQAHEIADRYPTYLTWLRAAASEGRAVWWPIPDLHAPPFDEAILRIDEFAEELRNGTDLLIHCAAGIGRSGTLAVCILIRLGVSQTDAVDIVALSRPHAGPEVGAQRSLVDAVARA